MPVDHRPVPPGDPKPEEGACVVACRVSRTRRFGWAPFLVFILGTTILAAFLLLWPEKRGLFLFGLYTVPSHVLISPFSHEPMLLWIAKSEPPWMVAAMATLGACLAGLLDYSLLVPLFSRYSIRSRYEHNELYQRSLRYFRRSPFGLLVIAGISPLPFFPFKFISIAGGYPLWKYESALVAGRTPRYYLLAWLGMEVRFSDWLLVLLAAVFFFGTLINILRKFIQGRPI